MIPSGRLQPSPQERKQGILLYYRGDDRWTQAARACYDWIPAPYWGRIRPVAGSFEVIANVIPRALQEGAEAWLLLFVIDAPNEALVFPLPVEADASYQSPEQFRGYLSALLEYIGGGVARWYPARGFGRLREYASRGGVVRSPTDRPIRLPARFEVLRTERPLWQMLDEEGPQSIYVDVHQPAFGLEGVTRHVHEVRRESLRRLVDDEDASAATALLDGTLARESARLDEWVVAQSTQAVPMPKVVDHFVHIIDPETYKMLRSAVRVAAYARRHYPDRFDFAIPGSGLWRAVERELSLSLIWHLRRQYGLAGPEPSRPTKDTTYDMQIPAGNRTISLNARQDDDADQFRGVELGTYKYLVEGGKKNGFEALISPVLSLPQSDFVFGGAGDSLVAQLEALRKQRNRYAHIQPMSLAEYEHLHSLVLTSPTWSSADSLLGRILDIKVAVGQYWEGQPQGAMPA